MELTALHYWNQPLGYVGRAFLQPYCSSISSYFSLRNLAVCGGSASLLALAFCYIQKRKLWWFTRFINSISVTHDKRLLDEFRIRNKWAPVHPYRAKPTNHPHPKAAAARCQATTTIQALIESVDLVRHDVSTSSREENKQWVTGKHSCTKLYYDEADLNGTPHDDEYRAAANTVVTMVDVDYYIEDFSRWAGRPMLLYTSVPQAVAGEGVDSVYAFVDENRMTEVVRGGARYTSRVWDYSPDLVIIKNTLGFCVYAVERQLQPNTHNRYLVLLHPRTTVRMPHCLFKWLGGLAGYTGGRAEPLKRMKMSRQGSYLGAIFTNPELQSMYSVRQSYGPITADHVDIPSLAYAAIRSQMTVKGKTPLYTADLERIMVNCCADKPPKWFSYFLGELIHCRPDDRFWVNYYVHGAGPFVHDEGKPAAKLGAPVIANSSAKAPTNTVGNDIACVTARVIAPRNGTDPPSRYKSYSREFRDLVVPPANVGKLVPVDHMVVIANQTSPMQRLRQAAERYHPFDGTKAMVIVSMQKKEAYATANDPRNISTTSQAFTEAFSRYMYAVKDYCKQYKWYCPGMTPAQTADAITDFCAKVSERGSTVVETDYSRFDGSMSSFLRDVEQRIYTALFHPSALKELGELLLNDANNVAFTNHGIRYHTGDGRLSGSPSTTVGNTIVNAFVAYCSYREMNYSVKESFARVGPKYGDDGLDDGAGKFVEVASDLGILLKLLPKVEKSVSFCGRIFVDPLLSKGSICDPIRALRRIPVITSGKPIHQGLTERVAGYLATDAATPLVGDYLTALVRVHDLDVCNYDVTDHDMNFRIRMGPYPYGEHESDREAALSIIARQFGVEIDVVLAAIEALAAAMTDDDLVRVRNLFPEDISEVNDRFVLVPEGREVGGNKTDHPRSETIVENGSENVKISKDDKSSIVVDKDDRKEDVAGQEQRQRERQRERTEKRERERPVKRPLDGKVSKQRHGVEGPHAVVSQSTTDRPATDDAVGERLPVKSNRRRRNKHGGSTDPLRIPDHTIGVRGDPAHTTVRAVGTISVPLV
jgi:hypothetical protein